MKNSVLKVIEVPETVFNDDVLLPGMDVVFINNTWECRHDADSESGWVFSIRAQSRRSVEIVLVEERLLTMRDKQSGDTLYIDVDEFHRFHPLCEIEFK